MNQASIPPSVLLYHKMIRISWSPDNNIINVRYFKIHQIVNVFMEIDTASQYPYNVVIVLDRESQTKKVKLRMPDLESSESITRKISQHSNW